MRKSYSFKKLGSRIQRLAAIMLITLMAVGNAFAQYDGTGLFTKINSMDELTSGYYVVTGTGDNGDLAMLNTGSSYINATTPVFLNPPANIVWRIDVDADGDVTFFNEAVSKYVEYHGNGNNAYLVTTVSEQSTWTPSLNSTGWVMTNVANSQRILSYNYNNGTNPRFAGYKGTQKSLALYKQGPAPAVMAPTFNHSSGTYYTEQTVELSCQTTGAIMYYSINGSEPVLYTVPFTVNATAEVTAYATLGEDQSAVSTLTLTFPAPLANIAAFYAAENGPYTITSDMTFVYRQGRYMYVKDATGGLLIYDNANSVITTQYNEGDVFTGGITGTRTLYNGLAEIVPVFNTAEAEATAAVTPTEVTVAQLLANPDNFMSQLVLIKNGTFNGGVLNNSGNPKKFSQDGNDIVIYNRFGNLTNAMMPENQTATVMGFVSIYNGTVQLFPRDGNDIALANIPFASNFDGASAYTWMFANGDNTNKWYVGETPDFDNNKLYVSSSNGYTNKYNVSVASVTHAYIPVTLPANDVLLSFDLRSVGDANDFVQVAVMDAAPVAGTLPTEYLARYYGVSDFTTETVLIPAENAGEKFLVFTWNNNASGGTQQPAAIDNLTLKNACEMVSDINATVNERTAVLTWTAPAGQNSWTVRYKDVNSEDWMSTSATSTTLTLNNLTTNTAYDVQIRSNCGEAASYWATYQFAVPCINVVMGPVDLTIGEGTSTSNIAPANAFYKNSWTQMVYPASNFETAGYINSISWYVNGVTVHNFNTFKIYIGTKASAENESTSDWVSMDDLTLVYEATNGSLGTAEGWETYTLPTPYFYNGEDNLVIVTSRTADAYNGVQYRYTSQSNSVLYRRSDSSPESYASHPGTNTGTRSSYLPNMRLDYTGFICDDDLCKVPANLAVEHHVANSIVTWVGVPGANAYEVQYAETGSDWNTVTVTGATTYILANLPEGASYNVRVRTVCGEDSYSHWTDPVTFTRPVYCDIPTSITHLNVTNNQATLAWAAGYGTSWVVEYGEEGFTLGEGTQVTTTSPELTLSGLTAETSYDVYVKANCGEYPSTWSAAHTFTTDCDALTVTVANPWFEDFEGYTGSGEKPFNCWLTPVKTSGGGPFVYCGYSSSCHSGANSAELKGYDNVLVLPAFTNDIHTLALSFWATAVTPSDGTLELGILTDVNDLTTFEFVADVTNPSSRNGVGNYMGPFSFENVTATGGRIALRYHSNYGTSNSWNLDDFTVFIPQNCNTPVNLAANVNVADAEAEITWNPFGEETAWQVQYGAAGFTLGNGTIADVTNATYTMTGLTQGASYDVYVRAMCSAAETSVWGGPVTFEVANACAQYCTYTLNLDDSYGDGWNGGVLTITQDGAEIGSYTVSSGYSATYTVDLCSGSDFVFTYTAGSYAYENSWTVVDPNGETIWSATGNGGDYTLNVTPNCGGCATTCEYTLNLDDSYGDGWNGGSLTVSQNGEELGTYTISSGYSATYTVELCDGAEVVFAYTAGSYAYENTMTVVAPDGSTVWTYNGGTSGSINHTITAACGGDVPEPCVSCEYTFELTDYYGDGWSGWSYSGSLDIEQGGALVQTLTMSNGYTKTVNVSLCNAEEVTLTLHPDYYEDEMGLTVTAPDGTVIWNVAEGSLSGSANVVFTFTPACVACEAPIDLVVDAVTSTSATLSWTGDTTATYNFYYKNMADNDWTVMDVTGTTVTLTLAANTTYLAKVKAACSTNEFTDEVTFFTTAAAIECADYTISEQSGYNYYTPVNDYYRNSRSEQIYSPTEVGGSGNITKISFNYQGSSTMTKKTNVKMYLAHTTKSEFSSTTDWTTSGMTLVYTGDLNCSTGWNEFVLDEAFAYNGTDNLIVIVDDESGQYGSSSNKFYYTNCTGYKCLTFNSDSYTWTNASSKSGTRRQYRPDIRFNVCSAGADVALMAIHNIPNGCDLSNLPVSIDIKATGESTVSTIEAYYRVNEGNAVHETITLAVPMNQGDEMTYTFNTLATLPLSSNTITVWVETPNDGDVANNILTAGPIENINPASIPFVETFNAGEINDGWFIRDINADEVTFTIANGVASYPYSDEVAANDWLMTTCMDISYPGTYDVSYSYKADDATMIEKFGVYFGQKVGDDYVMNHEVATHEFSNTEFVTVHKIINVAQAGIYYFGIHAESAPGNAGFQINHFNVKSAVNVTVNAGPNGSTTPSGSFYAALGEEATITIVPDFGYHVAAIYKNNMLVRGENTDNAAVEYYTFTVSNYNLLNVTFTANKYDVNAIVENQNETDYNDNAPGAVYTPNHEVVAHGGSHTGIITVAQYFHLVGVTVNGMDVTANLTALNANQYQLTLDNIYENKNINVVVDLDSSTIVYTVNGGQGVINNEFVVDANTTLPATYTVTLPGYSDLLSTITPAPGFHVESIFVDGMDHSNIDIYSFEYLLGNHTVVVTFAPNHYVITTNGFGYGTVSDGAEFDYDPDYTYTFTATPATGYSIATITRNNVALTVADPSAEYTETLTNILDNYDYVVTFAPSTYTITASCGNNGTISPLGNASYLYHQNAVYNINAAQGYYIASVTVDGTTTDYTQADALTSTTYTFSNIEADHAINVTFAQFIFTVTVNAGAHGAITPATATYAYGAIPTFTITPDAGYSIADVTVDGASVGAVATYTFLPINGDHTIAATFSANSYTIAATAGNGGTITPAGNTTVAYNANQAYTISANAGYHVSDVFVDGVSVGAVTTYTFTGVTANHTIYAAFESNEYTVTVNQPAHGAITPGTTTVMYGATPSFVITPAVGYNVTAITVNGTNVALANVPNVNGIYTYTFAAINANQTLTATMTAKTYTINASAGANGSITPNGNTTVNYGAAQAYTITPANGYVIDNVMVDNISMGAVSSYVFTNVTTNHTIAATFKAAECEVPSFLYTTHIDETSATLHWSHPTATTFDIQYKTATSNFTSVANVSGNSYQLTDLNPNTTYLWQVRAHCVGGNSDWANLVSFTTDANTIIDGIEDLVKGNIKVYAEHQNVHILNNEGMNIENVRIFDAYGKLVYSGAVSSSHEVINLNVAAGAYIVNVTTDEGVANYKVTILK